MANGARLTPEILAGWTDALQAIARTGLFYATDDYNRERYEQVLAIAADMATYLTGFSPMEIQERWGQDVGHVTPKVGQSPPPLQHHLLVCRRGWYAHPDHRGARSRLLPA